MVSSRWADIWSPCHTAGFLPSEGQVPESQWLLGDRLGWHGPWGTTYATNLRLLVADMTEDQWMIMARNLRARPPRRFTLFFATSARLANRHPPTCLRVSSPRSHTRHFLHREITAHTRDPIPEARLTSMAVDCGVTLYEIRLSAEAMIDRCQLARG
jgi:hypothetical protein